MWALITGGFMFGIAIIFSLGKASSKREEASHSHREELLARSQDSQTESPTSNRTNTDLTEQQQSHKGNTARRPSEQL